MNVFCFCMNILQISLRFMCVPVSLTSMAAFRGQALTGIIFLLNNHIRKIFFYLNFSDFQIGREKLGIILRKSLSKIEFIKKSTKVITINEKKIMQIQMIFDFEIQI